jgi:hypothetical protein
MLSDNSAMKGYIIGKILVAIIILTPVFFLDSCDKQEKCGCDGDILFSITNQLFDYSEIYVSANGGTMQFTEGYDTYSFCNPTSMYTIYQGLDADEQILLSGDVYWDCSYVSSAGQSSYYYYYKYYNINVTQFKSYLYGKK